MNDKLKESSQFFKNATIHFITIGTAWIYRQKVNGQIVSNCHKMPANTFLREKLSVQDIVNEYTDLFHTFPFSDKKTRVIFTVSPVRHTKDGLHENQLSKATLLVALDELQIRFDFVEYFPSYEMLLDDLRDYRFYNEDMVHPNNTAIKYLTEKLSSYFSEETKMLMNEAEQIASAESHRPFNPQSSEYQSFISSIHEKKSLLMTKIANIRKR